MSNGLISQRLSAWGTGYSAIVPVNDTYGTNGWPLFDPRFTAAIIAGASSHPFRAAVECTNARSGVGFYDSQPNTTGTNFPQGNNTEQPISTLPTWSSLYLTLGNSTYSPATPVEEISNWEQSMSIENGLVETSLTWTPAGMQPVNLTYTTFAHRTKPHLGVMRLDVKGLTNTAAVSITDLLDGAGSWRTDFADKGLVNSTNQTIYTAVRPVGISNITAYEVSKLVIWPESLSFNESDSCIGSALSANASTISRCYTLSSTPNNQTLTAVKYVGIASTDASADPYRTALQAAENGNATGYESLFRSHMQAWNETWQQADIKVEGEDELAQQLQYASRASLFYLLTNVRSGDEPAGYGDNSIAPAGLTSDSYSGQASAFPVGQEEDNKKQTGHRVPEELS